MHFFGFSGNRQFGMLGLLIGAVSAAYSINYRTQ